MIKHFYFKQFSLPYVHSLFLFTYTVKCKNSSISNNSVKHVLKVKWFQVLLCITNNSIKSQSSVNTQLNDQNVLFQIIQFSLNTQFKCQTVIDNP